MSGDAYFWAKAHPCPSPRAKAVLKALAGYAGADGVAWAPVSILLIETDLGTDRTVQRALAELKADGIIEDTGETKLHLGKLIPKYRLALEKGPANTRERLIQERRAAEAAEAPRDGGDLGVSPVSPQDACGDTRVTPSGDTSDGLGVSPVSPKYIQGNLQTNPKGARDGLAAGFERLVVKIPARMRKFWNPDVAWEAYRDLADSGFPVETLEACAERMAADPEFQSRKFAPPFETWLRLRQFEGWPEPAAPVVEAAPAAHAMRDDALPPDVVEGLGRDFCRSRLSGARWIEATRTIVPRTDMVAQGVLAAVRPSVLEALDLRIIAPSQVTQAEKVDP